MIPMFFGDTAKPLFGVYHHPEVGAGAHGVLLSSPVGHEYVRVHRMVRYLAVLLSRAGYPVLRFDFTGTGDSHGEAEDGNFQVWQKDLTTAANELRDTSGCRELSVIGIRLGATIAATVPDYPGEVRSIFLWDPVISGASYLDELAEQHRLWLGEASENGGPDQLLGTALSPRLVEDLRALDLSRMEAVPAGRIVITLSESGPESNGFSARLAELGAETESLVIRDEYGWHDPRAVETIITAPNMMREILRRLGVE